jgi:two-component system, OmpR family, alkaline phosphatase synthesis response regulator PhoP
MTTNKVLIVDDEPDILETIRFSLEHENIECIEAHDGAEAFAKAKQEHPDLILLDVMLPGIHGYKVAKLLKYDMEYKHIPIFMLTARAQESDIKLGEEVGADEYITKPFDMDKLIALVKKYLCRK